MNKTMAKIHKEPYNGWKDYTTWNVAQYINNTESLYQLAKECKSWEEFLSHSIPFITSDDERFDKADPSEMDYMIKETI